MGENNTTDTLNPDDSSDDDSLSSSSEDNNYTNNISSDDSTSSKSSIALGKRRIRNKRNGRKRANAKFSKIEFNRLENEKDMRRKINKIHPYPGHNSGLSVFNTIDVYDITFGTDPDQLEIIDWKLGAGRLSTLRPTTSRDLEDTDSNNDDGDTDSVNNHSPSKHTTCPCCRNLGTDTEDESMSSNFDAQYRRNKVAHDIIVAPYYMTTSKPLTAHSSDVIGASTKTKPNDKSQPNAGTDPPNINKQDDIHAWKFKSTKGDESIVPTLVFTGTVRSLDTNSPPHKTRILYDPGSGTQIMSPSYAKSIGILPVKMERKVYMKFGNNTRGESQDATPVLRINIQDVSFVEEFIVASQDIPNIDIIIGLSFQNRVKSEIRYTSKDKMPYVLFSSGERIYTDIMLADNKWNENTADVRYMACKEAYKFLKKNMPTTTSRKKLSENKWEDDTEVFLVSVHKQMELDGLLPTAPKKDVKTHPDIQKLLDKHDIMRTEVPVQDITNRPELQSAYHKLTLKPNSKPFRLRARPLSAEQMEVAQEIIQDAMHLGLMVEAPRGTLWGAPIMVIRKGGNRPGLKNQWRIVTDYRGLNKLTEEGKYAPPVIRELLERLVGKKFFSKSDNVGGFYQLPLLPEDYEKTSFVVPTPQGTKTYMFTVASLGLQGCPSTYQQFMEEVLEGIDDVMAYLDDVIYASDTWEEHLKTLDEAFARLAEHKVYLHPLKCEWGVLEIEYLGVKVSHNKISIADDKVAALNAYTPPTDFKGVRRFLGFAQYLAHFIPNYSSKVSVISDMLKGADKKKKFVWTSACQEAFDTVLSELQSSQGLGIPNMNGQLVLETDASGIGMGACLYQFANDQLVPLWYLSKKFSSAERNYSTRDREALAVIYSLKKFERYLLGRPFILYSDHESLSKFTTQPFLQGRDWRYQETICAFEFEQRYKKGELMTVPDALSRAFDDKETLGVWHDIEQDMGTIVKPIVGMLNSKDALLVASCSVDVNYLSMASNPMHPLSGIGINNMIAKELASKVNTTKTTYKDDEFSDHTIDHIPFFSIAARVFSDLQNTIAQAYISDNVMNELKTLAEKPLSELSAKQSKLIRKYSVVGDLLYYKVSETDTMRLCIPHNEGNGLRLLLLFEAHDGFLHSGSEKTYARLASRYWWPTMQKDCLRYCESCRLCRLQASRQQQPGAPVHGHPIPEGRWDVIHADWITDLPETKSGFDAILVVHDRVTKYAYFLPAMKIDTAETTAKRLFSSVFSVHGLPRMVISDRDHLFTAKFFAELMRVLDVKQHMGTSYQHDFNGAAEVLNKTVEVMLRHVVSDYPERDFDDYLPLIQWAYNTSVHKTIGVSPYYAMWGFEPRHPLDLELDNTTDSSASRLQSVEAFVEHQQHVLTQVRDALSASQDAMEGYINDDSRKDILYTPGEMVYLSTKNLGKVHFKQSAKKLRPRFAGPFKVLERVSSYTYKLELPRKMGKLHPIFHVALLWRDKPDKDMNAGRLKSNRDVNLVTNLTSASVPLVNSDSDTEDQQPLSRIEDSADLVLQQGTPTTTANDNHTVVQQDVNSLLNDGLADISDRDIPDEYISENGERLWDVEAILGRKKSGRGYKYLAKWLGFDNPDSNTWISTSDAMGTSVKKMIIDFNAKKREVKRLRGNVKSKTHTKARKPKVSFVLPSKPADNSEEEE